MNSAFLQAEHAGLNRIGIAFPSQESQSRHVRIGIREEHVSSFCGVPSRAGAILLCAGDCYNVTNVGTYARFGAWEASVAFPVQTAVHAVCWNVPSFSRHGIVRRGPRRMPHPTEGRVGVFRWSEATFRPHLNSKCFQYSAGVASFRFLCVAVATFLLSFCRHVAVPPPGATQPAAWSQSL
jgi:hypothetical protein